MTGDVYKRQIVESTAGKVEAVKNGEVKIDGTTYKVDSNVTTTALYTGKLIDGLNVGGNKAAAVKDVYKRQPSRW